MTITAGQIANLLAIVRAGSFTKAAERRGLSQPALSNSIAQLERGLGVRVLERSRQGSTLTPYGEILSRRAEGLQTLLDDAEREVRMRAEGLAGPLRIGATPSVLPTLMPLALASLGREHGPLEIEIIDGLDQAFYSMLATGRLDLIVGPVEDLFSNDDTIEETLLIRDPLALAVGPDNPLARRKPLSLADLKNAAWILPREGSNFRQHVEALFRTKSVAWPCDAILTNSIPLIETLLTSSDRVAIISPIQLSGQSNLVLIPLVEHGNRAIGYKTRRGVRLNALGHAFLGHLQAAAVAISREQASTSAIGTT